MELNLMDQGRKSRRAQDIHGVRGHLTWSRMMTSLDSGTILDIQAPCPVATQLHASAEIGPASVEFQHVVRLAWAV